MTDMLDLSQALIVNAPGDVSQWPMTAALTQVSFDGSETRVDFTKKEGAGRWPDETPPGWDGPLQYTIWLFLNISGQWVGSGFIQMWHGRDGSGSPADPDVPSRYDLNWFYDGRWSPIYGHGPIVNGETIGFMVTSGNARNAAGPYSVRERSNVVVFKATDRGVFDFPVDIPHVDPPVPPVEPPPTNGVTLATLHEDLQRIEAILQAHR